MMQTYPKMYRSPALSSPSPFHLANATPIAAGRNAGSAIIRSAKATALSLRSPDQNSTVYNPIVIAYWK